ncbi:MAG: MarR family transcriptional regulator [Oscillatoriales cyanobacterium C42_A2020_001]|nr:MarR family transcriptional regulator [Leptolyngbyaceae cyanobacterium C42_A2020_001]
MSDRLDEARSRMWRLFRTTYVTVTEQIEKDLEQAGLPPLLWYSVLWALERAPDHEMRLHELAEEVFLSRSNITRLIDRLEAAVLLCRKRCPLDRRGAYAALTNEGLAMRQKMWAVYSEGIAQYFTDHLSQDEVQVLDAVFDRALTTAQKLTHQSTAQEG